MSLDILVSFMNNHYKRLKDTKARSTSKITSPPPKQPKQAEEETLQLRDQMRVLKAPESQSEDEKAAKPESPESQINQLQ